MYSAYKNVIHLRKSSHRKFAYCFSI